MYEWYIKIPKTGQNVLGGRCGITNEIGKIYRENNFFVGKIHLGGGIFLQRNFLISFTYIDITPIQIRDIKQKKKKKYCLFTLPIIR